MDSSTPGKRIGKELVENAVFQLHAPASGQPTALDVVFFHGLQLGDYQRAWLTTWQSDADKPDGCWPARLLAKDFPQARILSVSYDSSARGGSMDLPAIREQLTTFLLSEKVGVGKRPVVFVGHSLGGLVLKEVCNELYKQAQRSVKHKQALDRVLGLVFYSTPHNGSRLADNTVVTLFGDGEVMSYLRTLDTDAARLNEDFRQLKEERKWSTLGFGEQKPICKSAWFPFKMFEAMVVEEASARHQMDKYVVVPNSNHITVCKPSTKEAASYLCLKEYLDDQFKEKAEAVATELRDYQGRGGKLFGRRRELQELSDALRSSRLGIITGGHGEGKSMLAYEVAAASITNLHFTKFINVDLGGQDWKYYTEQASALKELATRLQLGSWSEVIKLQPTTVILFHNTEDILRYKHSDAAKAFYTMVGRLHSIGAYQLITSCMELEGHLLPHSAPAPVSLGEGLGMVAACELLKHACKDKAAELTRSQVESIVGICERNPLLLRLLGGFLAAGEVTAQEIINSGILANKISDGVHVTVEKVRRLLSFLLGRHQEQLDYLAVLSLWDSFTEEQATAAALALPQPLATPQLLQHMARLSILQRTGQGANMRYGMHVLVRTAAKELLEAFERSELRCAATNRFLRTMAAVGDRAAKAGSKLAAREALSHELGNCRRFCPVPVEMVQDAHVKEGLIRLQGELYGCGFYSESVSVGEQLVKSLKQALDGTDPCPDTLHSMNELGLAYRKEGKLTEAVSLHREVLTGWQSLKSDTHPAILQSMSQLANTLRPCGEHAEAETLHCKVLAIRRSVLGNDHPDTLKSMNNLGNTLGEQGKHAEAEALHREALDGGRRSLRDIQELTVLSMSNLGETLAKQGKYAEAEPFYHEALAGLRSLLGNSHPDTLSIMHDLGNTLLAQGKLAEAEALHYEALTRRRSELGDTHPDTLNSMNSLRSTLLAQGKHADADELLSHIDRGTAVGGSNRL